MPSADEITSLLTAWSGGDASALDRLIPIVYADLRKVAANRLRAERSGHSLPATALVHETYLRLLGGNPGHLANRAHFFAVASELMRRILVDHARRKAAAKRGGGKQIPLEDARAAGPGPNLDLVALDLGLSELAALDARQGRVVELRFFGGLSIADTARVLGVSHATVEREWDMARAWLYRRLHGGQPRGSPLRGQRT